MAVDQNIYDLIYEQAERVPGYERYARYRDLVKTSADPFGAISQQEDVYWGIKEVLGTIKTPLATPLRILEIGSGMGYLTYALRQAGHNSIGIDISEDAVATARKSFGDHYRVADLMDLSESLDGTFDVIIATELIEHTTDPIRIIEKAASLLKANGKLVITTPNRDLYAQALVWNTDPPPVHLWWFSKTSFRYIAWKLSLDIGFVDFAKYYGRHATITPRSSKPQTFNASGQVQSSGSWLKSAARATVSKVPSLFRPLAKTLMVALSIGRLREQLYRDSLSLCVVLQVRETKR